jgi:hypothetical protein
MHIFQKNMWAVACLLTLCLAQITSARQTWDGVYGILPYQRYFCDPDRELGEGETGVPGERQITINEEYGFEDSWIERLCYSPIFPRLTYYETDYHTVDDCKNNKVSVWNGMNSVLKPPPNNGSYLWQLSSNDKNQTNIVTIPRIGCKGRKNGLTGSPIENNTKIFLAGTSHLWLLKDGKNIDERPGCNPVHLLDYSRYKKNYTSALTWFCEYDGNTPRHISRDVRLTPWKYGEDRIQQMWILYKFA